MVITQFILLAGSSILFGTVTAAIGQLGKWWGTLFTAGYMTILSLIIL